MSGPRVVVVGSSNTDLVVRASRIPQPGETVLGGEFLVAAGGKGANQAVAAARLGARVWFVGCVGADDFGRQAIDGLRAEGIDVQLVRRDATAASGVALIVVDDRGENAIAVAPGANHRLTPEDVDRAGPHIARADALLLQLEVPLPVVQHAARLARDAGVRVILNPAPAQPLDDGLLASVTVLTPNQSEAAALSAMPVTDGRTAEQAARALLRRGVESVVVTLGAAGALVVGPDAAELVPGVPVRAVDATAAGDAFNGALALELAGGRPLVAAVRFAVRAGAVAATRRGAQPSLPRPADLRSPGPTNNA